jgi:serine/threonine-protein kinase
MDVRRETTALEILEAALEWPPEEVDARLHEACAGDAELAARVKQLLHKDRRLLDSMPTQVPATALYDAEPPPERIGPYQLVDVVGVGGMGTVYRGERIDGLFQQTVAIKLVRPSMLGEELLHRFAAERRILARLQHRNIAQLFDGGTAANGHAYFIMEFVEGQSITDYAAQAAATIPAKLSLFASVCRAVQYAHSQLVVHADIKPSNILVSADGTSKLLDFGIAQFLGEESQGSSAEQTPAMTQTYAAPERRNGVKPTVVADVFSLGVLLHELLTGRLPDAATPLRANLPPDLAAIVQRAMAAQPDARYASVQELIADLERFQRREPVSAQPQTWQYRTKCFIRRHALGLAATGVVAVALIAAVALSTSLYLRAERERAAAEARFSDLRSLANYTMFDLYDLLARVPGTTEARVSIASRSQAYLDVLAASSGPFDVRLEAAAGLARLGAVQGVPNQTNLGNLPAAEASLATARVRLEELRREAPERRDVRQHLARTLLDQADMLARAMQRPAEAVPLVAQAGELLASPTPAELFSRGEIDAAWLDTRIAWHAAEITQLYWDNKLPEMRQRTEAALAEMGSWPAELRQSERYALLLSGLLSRRGDVIYYTESRSAALTDYREAERVLREAGERLPGRPMLLLASGMAQWSIATTLATIDRGQEALPEFEKGIAILRRVAELEPSDERTASVLVTLVAAHAETLSTLGRTAEAVVTLEELIGSLDALDERGRATPRLRRDAAWHRLGLGDAYWRAKRRDDACRTWQTSLDRMNELRAANALIAPDIEESIAKLQTRRQVCAGTKPASALLNELP